MAIRPYQFRTPKQKQKAVRARHLIDFRRYLALEGTGSNISDHLDMNAFELREYIESQWLPGMDWDNYREEWVVDHIVPLRYFDVFNHKEMKLCWNHNNLKPNYFMDNHAKWYCLEVTEKVLAGLPQNSTVKLLIKHVQDKIKMFEKYY